MIRAIHNGAMERRGRTAISFLVVVGLLSGACGGGGGSSNDAYGERNAVAVQGSSVTVHMKDLQFQPMGIKVKLGTKVTWVDDEPVIHNVRQVQDVFLSPDVLTKGQTFSFTFDTPGTYRYQCTYHHPKMNGVVIVEK